MAAVHYFTARRCLTGVSEYRFFRETEPIGSAAAFVLPDYPVALACGELQLHCSHNPDRTLVPGCRQGIFYGGTPEEFAAVFWDGTGRHLIHTPFGTIQVVIQEGMYLFLRNNVCIGAMRTIQKEAPPSRSLSVLPDPDWDMRMTMMTETQLPDVLALLLLSFPLLQIGP